MSTYNEAQRKATNKYREEKSTIQLIISKELKDIINQYCLNEKISMNKYIINTIIDDLTLYFVNKANDLYKDENNDCQRRFELSKELGLYKENKITKKNEIEEKVDKILEKEKQEIKETLYILSKNKK